MDGHRFEKLKMAISVMTNLVNIRSAVKIQKYIYVCVINQISIAPLFFGKCRTKTTETDKKKANTNVKM